MPGRLSAAEIASMTAIVAASLDVSVVVKRNVPGPDGYGHTTEALTTIGTFNVNVAKPSATQLQAFAGIIGSQKARMLRFMPTSDIRENDIIVYNSINWRVQNIENAESYTFANNAIMTAIT